MLQLAKLPTGKFALLPNDSPTFDLGWKNPLIFTKVGLILPSQTKCAENVIFR